MNGCPIFIPKIPDWFVDFIVSTVAVYIPSQYLSPFKMS